MNTLEEPVLDVDSAGSSQELSSHGVTELDSLEDSCNGLMIKDGDKLCKLCR